MIFANYSKFFCDLGFDVYGIDISKTAIEKCISNNGFEKEHFKAFNILEDNKTPEDVFGVKFDLIFASEVMYYFDDEGIRFILKKFHESMKEEAVFMANMITFIHPYDKDYKKEDKREFVKIRSSGTVHGDLYVNVMNDKTDVEELFNIFECKKICNMKKLQQAAELRLECYHFIR